MEKLGQFVAWLFIMTITIIINAFVFMKLWSWFIVEIFNYKSLSLAQCMGVLTIIGFVRSRYEKSDKEDEFWVKTGERFVFVILMCLFALLYGWIIKQFM